MQEYTCDAIPPWWRAPPGCAWEGPPMVTPPWWPWPSFAPPPSPPSAAASSSPVLRRTYPDLLCPQIEQWERLSQILSNSNERGGAREEGTICDRMIWPTSSWENYNHCMHRHAWTGPSTCLKKHNDISKLQCYICKSKYLKLNFNCITIFS